MPDLEPITRKEMIIAGEDLEPITREEWFLKQYAGGGGGGSDQIMFIHGTVDRDVVTLDKTHAEIYEFVKDGDKTAIIILQYRESSYVSIYPHYFVLNAISSLSPYMLTFTYVGAELLKRSDNKTYSYKHLVITVIPDGCRLEENRSTLHLGFEIEGVLEAGETEITLSDINITTSDTFDIYTNVFGVDPTNVTVANGRITLTFDMQDTDMNVKVRVS